MADQAHFTVSARFPVKLKQHLAFLDHAREKARQPLPKASACHPFDILSAADDDNTGRLVKAYTKSAFT